MFMFNTATTIPINMPVIPRELIVPIEQVSALERVPLYKEDGSIIDINWYRMYKANKDLTKWIIKHCPVECSQIEYIVSDYSLLLHKDSGRSGAINYIIDAGGDNIRTEFVADNETDILTKKVFNQYEWHYLNVSCLHRVVGDLVRPRYLLSLTPTNCVTYKFDWKNNKHLTIEES